MFQPANFARRSSLAASAIAGTAGGGGRWRCRRRATRGQRRRLGRYLDGKGIVEGAGRGQKKVKADGRPAPGIGPEGIDRF